MAPTKQQFSTPSPRCPAPDGIAADRHRRAVGCRCDRRQGVLLAHGRSRASEGLGAGARARGKGSARCPGRAPPRWLRSPPSAGPARRSRVHAGAHRRARARCRAAIRQGVPGVEAIIAVASGKGGVGKSTTAVNLALGLASLGLKTGILDADIYGPSLPKLLAIRERPQTLGGTRLKPITRYGLTVMSIGFLIDEETPMIWRGPMVISALTQMLREVEWGEARRHGGRHAARHRRRPAHHGAAGAAQGRGHRLDAAGSRADRRAARHRHVQRSTCRCSALSRT